MREMAVGVVAVDPRNVICVSFPSGLQRNLESQGYFWKEEIISCWCCEDGGTRLREIIGGVGRRQRDRTER